MITLPVHILVVDDHPNNLRIVATILQNQGYQVRLARDGPQALFSARNDPPDLILLDIMMPHMDGYDVCKALKADKRTRDSTIIFVSALHEAFDKVRAFAAGGVDYIAKPFQIDEMLARINTHLTLRQMQQRLQSQNAQLEQALAERRHYEEAYHNLVQFSLQGLMILQEGRVIFANPAIETIHGYTVAELMAMLPDELLLLIHPDDRAWVTRRMQAYMAGQVTAGRNEHRILRKNGDVCWVEVYGAVVDSRAITRFS